MKEKYIGIMEKGDSVYSIYQRDNKLIAGTVCNAGIIEHYSIDYDDIFSLDEHLQALSDIIDNDIE